MKEIMKKLWPYLVAVVLFVALSCIYMYPEFNGLKIGASDMVNGHSAVQEVVNYSAETGNSSWWTGSMYSGMPNYQIGGNSYMSDSWLHPLTKWLHAGKGSPAAAVLLYCLCFFVLLLSMKIEKWYAMIGAIAMALSSYFIIIIGAGHNAKTPTIALMSLALAGFYLIFNNHRRTGVCLAMVGTMAGFYSHPQMAYYICFIFAAFGCAELYKAWKGKAWKPFVINCVIALAALGIGVGTGTANTFSNMEYVNETMRGGQTDLVKKATDTKAKETVSKDDAQKDEDATSSTGRGLAIDYATTFSYGITETMTLCVPNYYGGSSHYNVGTESWLFKNMTNYSLSQAKKAGYETVNMQSIVNQCANAPMYWGEQPFTYGPVYIGIVIIFLFILSLVFAKGPYKWALLAVTILAIMLSWGKNMMWLTELFFNYFPMYNKFRAISSILIIAEITMPLMAFLGLKQILDGLKDGSISKMKLLQVIGYVTCGMCLFFLVVGNITISSSTFASMDDATTFANSPRWFFDTVISERKLLLKNDIWRTCIFIVLTAGALATYAWGKMKGWILTLCLGVLVVADMWPVDKRYMNEYFFRAPIDQSGELAMQPWEKQILDNDKDPNFRVFNKTGDSFNEARTSLRLKSIGGYSAAKLRRYNDIIEEHLKKGNMPVINMLNTKYIITADSTGKAIVQKNDSAMGNAWFVDNIVKAANPNEECYGLMKYDLHHQAIVGKDFADKVQNFNPGHDDKASVKLTKYTPEYIEYDATCSKPGTIVFSEIYYPYGWKAIVDGNEVEHYRVNYILRALNVAPGKHHIRFEFRPDSITKGNTISMVFVVLMYLIVIGCIGWGIKEYLDERKKKAA